jgi:hypothetical protein
VLSQSQLEQALFAQRKDGRKLGQLLIELGLVSETQLTQTLSRQLSVPWVSLYHVDFSRSLLNLLSREIAERYCVVPILVRRVRKQGDTLYIAMDDPTNDSAIDEIARAVSLAVKPMIACPSDIRAAIRVYYLGETIPGPTAVPALPQPLGPRSVPNAPPKKAPTLRPAKAREAPAAPIPAAEGESEEKAPEPRAKVEEIGPARRMRPKMISLTLLDGTSISIPRTHPKAFTARRGSDATRGIQRPAHGARPRQRVAGRRSRSRCGRDSWRRAAMGGHVLGAFVDPPPQRHHRGLGVRRRVSKDLRRRLVNVKSRRARPSARPPRSRQRPADWRGTPCRDRSGRDSCDSAR